MEKSKSAFRIGGAALNQTPIDWIGNLNNIKKAIELGKAEGLSLLCLPELCITGYGCEDLFLADWIYQKAFECLLGLLPDTIGISVVVGLPFKHEGKNYNGAALLSDQKLLGIRLKRFLPKEGIHYEFRWFEPWPEDKIEAVSISGHDFIVGEVLPEVLLIEQVQRLGFEICEDAWQGYDRPAIKLAHSQIKFVVNPSASHFSFSKWQTRHQLVEEGSKIVDGYYIYVNQLGNEAGRVIYDGDVIIGYKGKVICSGPRLSYTNISLAWVEIGNDFEPSQVSHPVLQETYSKEEEFTAAATLGLFDYLRKSRSKNYVLSLSGGADSSTCAVLVAEMVARAVKSLEIKQLSYLYGIDSGTVSECVNQLLWTAYQSTKNSGSETFEAAKYLAESINAKFFDWSVQPVVDQIQATMEKAIDRPLQWATDDIALQNVQARARSPFIWMLTNLSGGLLLTTSNRSEGDVGYATMDGDTSGSLAPIAGVDKVFIRQWLKWAETKLGYEGLSKVNALEPTAELRPSETKQSDETDLMPYPLLLAIEELAIHKRQSPRIVFDTLLENGKFEKDLLKRSIIRFYQLWTRNQWKRERLAPSFHLDDFNVDPRSWCRFPILSSGFETELNEIRSL